MHSVITFFGLLFVLYSVNSENVCLAGSYCPNNITTGCNSTVQCTSCDEEGTYCEASTYEIESCEPGFFCPTTSEKFNCTIGSYCPINSINETNCSLGFFCPNTTIEIICPEGYYCNETGLTSPTGECYEGKWCPEGSTSPEGSECKFGYFGFNCLNYSCFGINSINKSVCSNHGICSKLDICDCDPGWKEKDCSMNSFISFGLPLLLILSVTIISLFGLLILTMIVCTCFTICVKFSQIEKEKKFDVDKILENRKVDDDGIVRNRR